jgi:hypothetical protein
MKRLSLKAEGRDWAVFDVAPGPGVSLAPALAAGWLCFESSTEVRRLAPIPAGWESRGPEELARLLARATPAHDDTSRGGTADRDAAARDLAEIQQACPHDRGTFIRQIVGGGQTRACAMCGKDLG